MTKPKVKRMSIETVLYDPGAPEAMKRELMLQLASSDDEKSKAILSRWFENANRAAAKEQYLRFIDSATANLISRRTSSSETVAKYRSHPKSSACWSTS